MQLANQVAMSITVVYPEQGQFKSAKIHEKDSWNLEHSRDHRRYPRLPRPQQIRPQCLNARWLPSVLVKLYLVPSECLRLCHILKVLTSCCFVVFLHTVVQIKRDQIFSHFQPATLGHHHVTVISD
jgi:hypothetical protein